MRRKDSFFWASLFLLIFPFSILTGQENQVPPAADPAPEAASAETDASSFVDEGAWTMVVLPDTQNYVKNAEYQGIFDIVTGWIHKNRTAENIQVVLHVGDIVNHNNTTSFDGVKNSNQLSQDQWEAARRSLSRLSQVPCVLVPGNHDYGRDQKTGNCRESYLGTYFPLDWNPANAGKLIEACDNFFGEKTLESAAYEFDFSPDRKMLVLGLEFAPSDRVIDWAQGLIAREEYKNHFVVIVTHSYIGGKGDRIQKESYKIEDANYGETLWEKLIYPSDNIRMVVCGHVANSQMEGSTIHSVDQNHAGRNVWQFLFDTQLIGGGNGGDGWIRLIRFSGDGKKARIQTFSPLFDISPTTRGFAWERGPECEYEIDFD